MFHPLEIGFGMLVIRTVKEQEYDFSFLNCLTEKFSPRIFLIGYRTVCYVNETFHYIRQIIKFFLFYLGGNSKKKLSRYCPFKIVGRQLHKSYKSVLQKLIWMQNVRKIGGWVGLDGQWSASGCCSCNWASNRFVSATALGGRHDSSVIYGASSDSSAHRNPY
jgi:hypothetical protein